MSETFDTELGAVIRGILQAHGIETPVVAHNLHKDKWLVIEESFRRIMQALQLDVERDDSLSETPQRVATMFVQEIFYGLDYRKFPACSTFDNKAGVDEMITSRATVMSTCEHHFVPFIGTCHVAYLPGTRLIGLSKVNRLVDFFSRRPQVQERLTEQIYAALTHVLKTEDVGVVIRAKHFCVHIRGVKDAASETTTSKMGGRFRTVAEARAEFLAFVHNGR